MDDLLEKYNELYWTKGNSLRDVANELGMDQATMRYRIKKLGGRTRTKGQAQSLAILSGRRAFSGEDNPNYKDGLKTEYGFGQRWSQYGITGADFSRMLDEQDGCCSICQCEFKETPHIDHCHNTGLVRGLLCSSCNRGLGMFFDSVSALENAIKYLNKERW